METTAPPPPEPATTSRLATRGGYEFLVRPVEPADEGALAAMFDRVAPEDLRFRFLTAFKHVSPGEIHLLTHVDHKAKESLVAIDPASGAIVASAMFAIDGIGKEAGGEAAEVAISVAQASRGLGIGWTLLAHVATLARQRGLKRLYSLESRDNHDAINLEREMGFAARPYPDDPTLVLIECAL